MVRPVRPVFTALREETALPSGVRGPVEWVAFSRLAWSLGSEVGMDFSRLHGSSRKGENELSTCGKDRDLGLLSGVKNIFSICDRDRLGKMVGFMQPEMIPAGFRSGVVTGITVVLGFSLLFLRSWVFELPGEWTPLSVVAAVLLLLSIIGQVYSLWRSLQLEDESVPEYRRTVRWFMASTSVLLSSLVVAGFAYANVKG